ncbi:MAG: FAD-binding oxidoreductase [Alteromonadaceae bacterium]|nr:FAD-binding oxidoreductase [Alteromonadaceae bacterium]
MEISEKTSKKKSIAVVGAGIVGINCALALQSQGFNVTLLDQQGIGEGCSKNNAGHFATEQVFPLADARLLWQLPKLLLDPLGAIALSPRYLPQALPWFIQFFNNMRSKYQQKNTLALKALNKNAISYYLPLLQQAKAEHLLTTQGSLLVFETTNLTVVKKSHQHYQQAGVAVKLLNSEQVHQLEPNLHKNINYALYFTEVAHTVSPYKLSLALAQLAQDKGMVFKQFTLKNITHTANKVLLNDGQQALTFDKLILATGAWSKKLCKQLGYNLPIEAERGYSLSLTTQNNDNNKSSGNENIALLSRPVASTERKFIITPMDNELRLSGTVEYAGLYAKANYKRATMLYKNAQFILDKLPTDKHIAKQDKWMGCRPSLPDSLPVICQAPQQDNIFFALGHQHLGLTQGAITGKLISQLIMKQPTDIDIKAFCISRFN